ncbi:MAG: hypothetical protein WDZ39_00210 [Candidatus Spechtbacterales bacterium]
MANPNDQKNTGGTMRTMAGDLSHVRAGKDIEPEKIDLSDPETDDAATPDTSTQQNTSASSATMGNNEAPKESLENLLPLNEEEADNKPSEPSPAQPPAPDMSQQTPPPPQVPGASQEPSKPFALSENPQQEPEPPAPGPEPPAQTEKSNIKKFLILGLAVVLISAIGGGAAYFLLGEEDNGGQVTQPPENGEGNGNGQQEIQMPSSLVTPDMVNQGLVVANTQAPSLQTLLTNFKREFENADAPAETLTFMPIRIAGTEADDTAEFIDAQTFLEGLAISTPDGFLEAIESDFMLYAYSPGQKERAMCQENLIAASDCYGVRLGMLFKAQEGQEEALNDFAAQWEELIDPSSGIGSLVLSNLANIPSEGMEFITEEYQSNAIPSAPVINVRYYNLPMPQYEGLQLSTTAIDIAAIDEYIIVATSKNSMLKMIDRVLEDTAS